MENAEHMLVTLQGEYHTATRWYQEYERVLNNSHRHVDTKRSSLDTTFTHETLSKALKVAHEANSVALEQMKDGYRKVCILLHEIEKALTEASIQFKPSHRVRVIDIKHCIEKWITTLKGRLNVLVNVPGVTTHVSSGSGKVAQNVGEGRRSGPASFKSESETTEKSIERAHVSGPVASLDSRHATFSTPAVGHRAVPLNSLTATGSLTRIPDRTQSASTMSSVSSLAGRPPRGATAGQMRGAPTTDMRGPAMTAASRPLPDHQRAANPTATTSSVQHSERSKMTSLNDESPGSVAPRPSATHARLTEPRADTTAATGPPPSSRRVSFDTPRPRESLGRASADAGSQPMSPDGSKKGMPRSQSHGELRKPAAELYREVWELIDSHESEENPPVRLIRAGTFEPRGSGQSSTGKDSAVSLEASTKPDHTSKTHDAPAHGGNTPATSSLSHKEGDEELRAAIEADILDRSPGVAFDDIAGMEDVKSALREMIILPVQRPDLFSGLRAPGKGILLFGPPGTGKTMVAKAVASTAKATFFSISASSLSSKWHGETEKLMRVLFEVARERQPSFIFIDEIDSVLGSRGDGEHEASRRLKTEFMVQFDGAAGNPDDSVYVLGATNRPQDLDDAVIRRLSRRIFVPLPDVQGRTLLLKKLTLEKPGNVNWDITEDQLEEFAISLSRFSGADIHALCREAALTPLRELGDKIASVSPQNVRGVTLADFEEATNVIRPTASMSLIRRMDSWNLQYGSSRRNPARSQPDLSPNDSTRSLSDGEL